MNRMPPCRSVLALVILLLVTLWAVPAYPWHGSGNITALAIAPRTDPETPTTLYAGTSDRGVFRSTDGGATWSATGLTNVSVTALAIDPVTPTTLYAVTGTGVFKSTDGGANWNATGLTNVSIQALAVDPRTPTTLYAAIPGTGGVLGEVTIGGGVFKSTDGGATWNAVLRSEWFISYQTAFVQAVAINPQVPTTLYAYVFLSTSEMEWGENVISTDGGTNWGGAGHNLRVLAIDPKTSTTLYAAGTDATWFLPPTVSGLLKSIDGGWNWIAIGSLPDPSYALAIDPVTPTTLYAAGTPSGVDKSMDGGATWSAVNSGLTNTLLAYGVSPGVRTLAIDPVIPTVVYAGTSIGVFKSTDGGANWTPTGLFQHSPLTSVSLNPTSVTAGTTSTGTVTLITAAPAGGITVTLSSSNTALATVPASVTVAAGATSANFTVSTSSVTYPSWVDIYAVFDGATRYAQLTVIGLVSVNLSLTSVTGGTTSTGRVNLSAAAPAGGAVVELSSSNPAVATIPASVTVPAGDNGANFLVSTSAVAASTAVTISGAYGGVTKSAVLTVTPPTLSSVSLNPTSVTAGSPSTGTVTLGAAAPAGGAAVALSSGNPAVATVPVSVTVPAGATSTNFTVSTSAVTASTTVTISGTYTGTTRSAELSVIAATTLSSVSLNPTSVPAGSPSTGTVTLSAAAPAGGAAVALSSSDTSVATVPGSVTVGAGATSANFTVSTSSSCTSSAATILGTYGGVARSAGLTVTTTPDIVTIQQADYFTSKRELRVAAKSSNSTAMLKVYVTSSGELIGTLRNLGDGKYSAQLSWPVNPQNVRVVSSGCGSAASVVRSK